MASVGYIEHGQDRVGLGSDGVVSCLSAQFPRGSERTYEGNRQIHNRKHHHKFLPSHQQRSLSVWATHDIVEWVDSSDRLLLLVLDDGSSRSRKEIQLELANSLTNVNSRRGGVGSCNRCHRFLDHQCHVA